MEPQIIEQFKKLGRVFNADKIVSAEDIDEVLKGVLTIMNSFKKGNQELNAETKQILDSTIAKIEAKYKIFSDSLGTEREDLSKKIKDAKSSLGSMIADGKTFLKEVEATKPKDGKNGENGKDGEDGSPDTPEQVRDKLESLVGEERLSITAIDNLAEILEELTKKLKEGGGKTSGNVYGGGRVRFLDDEAFIGTVNGVNTIFKLKKTPATGSLKVYRNGARQKVVIDYTFDGYRTVTFLTAPMADRGDGLPEDLFYDMRY